MQLINKELEQVKNIIKDSIEEILPENSISNFLFGSGKYIRSSLAILYYKALDKNLNKDFFNILVAGELIHNASLLHDDVIDEAEFRRNNTTISKTFSPKISILAGDYLLSIAFEKLFGVQKEIIKLFESCSKKMIKGEVQQFLNKNIIPKKEEYIKICGDKTGCLFETLMNCCALVLGDNDENAAILGKLFGLCFQIKNDLETHSAKNDKKNGIHTAKDVLGIEKTYKLLDNYCEEMEILIKNIPNNIYKKALEDLIKNLCTIERS